MTCRTPSLLLAAVLTLTQTPPARAADDPCTPEAVKAWVERRSDRAKLALRQIDQLCKKIELPTTKDGSASLGEVLALAFGEVRKGRHDRLKPTAPPGMPVGVVLAVAGQVVLDYSAVAAETVTAIEVDGPRLQLRQRDAGSGSVAIAAAQLQPGQDYKWVLRTRRQVYDGTFSLPQADKAERVQARLKLLPTLSDNPITLLALEAAIYDDEDMYGARDATVAKLRRELQ